MSRTSPVHRLAGAVSRGERGVQIVAGAMAGLLIAGSVTVGVVGDRSATREAQDADLRAGATAEASAINSSIAGARSVARIVADNSQIKQAAAEIAADRSPTPALRSQIEAALVYLEKVFPRQITEASLIDRSGAEVSRVVDGVAAAPDQLSTDQALSSFFPATMTLGTDQVWQADPYLSTYTHQWVVSTSTPVYVNGTPWAMLHFETPLVSLHPTLTAEQRRAGLSVWVVDSATGRVLLRDGHAVGGATLGGSSSSTLHTAVSTGHLAATINGRRAALVSTSAGLNSDANWTIVVWAPTTAGSLVPPLLPTTMVVTAILLLLLSWALLRARHRRIQHASLTDELTGLPNRRMLADRLQQVLQSSRRREATCAILLVDLDRFKEVNDTLGHHYGDELLREVGHRLHATVRESDTVARLSGDEFAVLLREVPDAETAVRLARRCLAELHRGFHIEDVTLDVEASIGLVLIPQHGHNLHTVMRAADIAMYAAKENRLGVVCYNPEHDTEAPSRIAMLGDLRRALSKDELVLHYQPKVNLQTGRTHAVEALVRWQHPTRGFVPPGQFIPIAENTALMLPLTLHTVNLAMRQARQWMDAGRPLQVAVNLSPRCLLEPTLPELVTEHLDRHGVPASLLRLEVTEGTVMGDPDRALDVLNALRASGIHLSIDDFGTGYSSLAYLKRLPVDELKIDRTFVLDLLSEGGDALVRAAIDLGHTMGMSVVAEGVEDEARVAVLTTLGCDSIQGYVFAKPMSAQALGTWLADADAATDTTSAAVEGAPA